MNSTTKDWYNKSYGRHGIGAQRRYPNEELCRFMGRNFLNVNLSPRDRKKKRILELGCGSCANLWMIAREGFDAYGCDLSEEGITLGKQVLNEWGTSANLTVCDMTATPYKDSFFDAILDVFSSNCLCKDDYLKLLQEAGRIIKPGGLFFSYFPSKKSDTYVRSTPENRIDSDTLRKNDDSQSPFYGNLYPFRFMSQEDVCAILPEAGFTIQRIETCGRTYNSGAEYFEFLVFEAVKDKADS